jgi:MerR family copper efflux transcriptional regulator
MTRLLRLLTVVERNAGKMMLDPGMGSRVETIGVRGESRMADKMLRSGELARLAGVSTDLLRHYERIRIVQPPQRAANGYRLYAAGTLGRVQTVRRALSMGFSLAELARIFAVRDRGGAPCRSVRALAEEKLRQTEQNLVQLKALRRQLQETLQDWDRRLAKVSAGKRAGLLESLEADSPGLVRGAQRLKKGFKRK